jgi:hypothetical protein
LLRLRISLVDGLLSVLGRLERGLGLLGLRLEKLSG